MKKLFIIFSLFSILFNFSLLPTQATTLRSPWILIPYPTPNNLEQASLEQTITWLKYYLPSDITLEEHNVARGVSYQYIFLGQNNTFESLDQDWLPAEKAGLFNAPNNERNICSLVILTKFRRTEPINLTRGPLFAVAFSARSGIHPHVVTVQNQSPISSGVDATNAMRIDLGKIALNSVRTIEEKYQYVVDVRTSRVMMGDVYIPVNTLEQAQNLQQGFYHLAKLCGALNEDVVPLKPHLEPAVNP